jgi:Mlc titration factor MtfA (ptsG expression regulator)|tara:strand:- start:2167 stop:2343 length:177 start_codon:yes stop_codon:yes gene_type:complete
MEAINDNHSDIRKYGGTNQAEFFAVASEYFFERSDLLKKKHPELYKMLVECFNQKSIS